MQAEIDAENWPVHAQILGVNEAGAESDNARMCEGRSLPWLQDTASVNAWGLWNVSLRDIVILDRHNVWFAVFDGDLDLSRPVNYDALKSLLRQASQVP
jgi:hypothetical protein